MITMPDPLPILSALLIALCGIVVAVMAAARARVLAPTMAGLAAHFFVATVFYLRLGLWAPDAQLYDRLGMAYQNIWFENSNRQIVVTAGKEGFPSFLGILYGVFGHLPFLGIMVNVIACALIVPVVATTAARLGLKVRASAWLAALFPPGLLWGSLLLREAFSWLSLAVIVCGLVGLTARTSSNRPAMNWFLILSGTAVLLSIRGTAAILVAAAALLTVAAIGRSRFWPAVFGVITLAIAGPALAGAFQQIAGGYDLQNINRVRGALSTQGNSSFAVSNIGSLPQLIVSLPKLLLRSLLGPYPWEWPRVGLLGTLDAILWLALLFFVVQCLRSMSSRISSAALIAPAFAVLIVLSVASGNYGTLARLRDQAAIILIPLAGHGWTVWRERSRSASLARDTSERHAGRAPGQKAGHSYLVGRQPRR